MKNSTRETIKHYMRFVVYFVGIQFIVYLIRTMFFTAMVGQSYYDSRYNGNTAYVTITIVFSVIAMLSVCIITALIKARDAEKKRLFRTEYKQEDLTVKQAFLLGYKRTLGHTVVFAALSVPFLIFYSIWGYTYDTAIVSRFELFYSLQAGFYELVHSGILGFLISCATFFVVSEVFDLFIYRSWNSDRV